MMICMKQGTVYGYVVGNKGNRSLGVYTEKGTVESALRATGLHVDDVVKVNVRQGNLKATLTGKVVNTDAGRQICYDWNSLKGLDKFDIESSASYTFSKLKRAA